MNPNLIVGQVPQYANGSVALASNTSPIDAQGNFSIAVPTNMGTQTLSLHPQLGSPYGVLPLTVSVRPGKTNVTKQAQEAISTVGTFIGIPDSVVATNEQGFAIPSSSTTSPQQSYTAYTSFGDSITAGYFASIPANAYVNLLGTFTGASVTNPAVSGSYVADVAQNQGVFNSSPVDSNNPLVTMMIGTNEANETGPGAYEAVYNLICQAIISWQCTSSSQKYTGASFGSAPTNWSLDTTFTVNGLRTTTQGAVSQWPIATTGGPVAIWYRIIDGNGGIFTYSVDGSTPVAVNNFTSPAIGPTPTVGVTESVGVAFIQGLGSGNHVITITATSATGAGNVVSIIGVGTTPAQVFLGPPAMYVAGVPYQESNANATATAAYNQDALNNVSLLSAMGFNVYPVNVRNYWPPDPSGYYNTEHPNDLGMSKIYQGFASAINPIGVHSSSSVPIATTSVAGIVKPNGTTITVAGDGTIASPYPYGPLAANLTSGVNSVTALSTDTSIFMAMNAAGTCILGSLGEGKIINVINYGPTAGTTGSVTISCGGGNAENYVIVPGGSIACVNGGANFWFIVGVYVPA